MNRPGTVSMSNIQPGEQPIGVLLMAYGGPESVTDIPGYLADIRDGRPTTPAVLTEITRTTPRSAAGLPSRR